MKNSIRILMSVPTRSHVEIAQDELEGLRQLGYGCTGFSYSAKENVNSWLGRLWVLMANALALVAKTWSIKPDVIYFNSRLEVLASTRDFITILIVKLFCFSKVRFMIKSHGSDLDVLSSSSFLMSKIVMPFLKRNVSAWLFLSNEEKDNVIEQEYFSSKSIFLTKNIVRTEQFVPDHHFRKHHKIANDDIILLFTGRFIKEKGVYEVLAAFEKLVDRYPITLILVGDGQEYPNLVKLVADKNLTEKTVFTGFITEQNVVPYYSNCDILVFPTYFPEGFPMALFNAVGAGMAVVTTPIRAAKDYLSAPENCLWVSPNNSASVQRALATLIKSCTLRKEMRDHNMLTGLLFSQQIICNELSTIINQILMPNESFS